MTAKRVGMTAKRAGVTAKRAGMTAEGATLITVKKAGVLSGYRDIPGLLETS